LGTHQFDLFCTWTIFISSTFSGLRPLYFGSRTSTTLLRLAYFDRCTSTFCQIWIFYWSRSTVLVEVQYGQKRLSKVYFSGSKYRKARRYEHMVGLILNSRSLRNHPISHFVYANNILKLHSEKDVIKITAVRRIANSIATFIPVILQSLQNWAVILIRLSL